MTVSDRRRGDVPGIRRDPCAIVIFGISLLLSGLVAARAYADPQPGSATEAARPQSECPVMVGNAIDPAIFVDYEGKRVFFCCQTCKSAFLEAPTKYLPRLPQFAAASGGGAEREHAAGFSTARLVAPMGIVTLSLVAIAVGLAVFWKRVKVLKPKTVLNVHKAVGASALVAGIIHVLFILLAD